MLEGMSPIVLSLLLAAPTQADPATGADPNDARVIIEDMGTVGLRISDAQAVATDVMTSLRKRMGNNAVIFEGTLTGNLKMKKLLGANAESQIQEDQIAYLKAAVEKAPFLVRVRFGTTKKTHWVTLSCRNNGAPPEKTLEEKRFEGATFGKAREAMNQGLEGFCRIADPKPASAVVEQPREKKKREWTLPPRRE